MATGRVPSHSPFGAGAPPAPTVHRGSHRRACRSSRAHVIAFAVRREGNTRSCLKNGERATDRNRSTIDKARSVRSSPCLCRAHGSYRCSVAGGRAAHSEASTSGRRSARQNQLGGNIHRRQLRDGERGEPAVGKPSGARARSGWQPSMLMVIQSGLSSTVRPPRTPSSTMSARASRAKVGRSGSSAIRRRTATSSTGSSSAMEASPSSLGTEQTDRKRRTAGKLDD